MHFFSFTPYHGAKYSRHALPKKRANARSLYISRYFRAPCIPKAPIRPISQVMPCHSPPSPITPLSRRKTWPSRHQKKRANARSLYISRRLLRPMIPKAPIRPISQMLPELRRISPDEAQSDEEALTIGLYSESESGAGSRSGAG